MTPSPKHTEAYQELLASISDSGLYKALEVTGEGKLSEAIIELMSRLKQNGFQLTSYQVSDRGGNYYNRRWAVYPQSDNRPQYFKQCSSFSDYFSNILSRKTEKCSAYKELMRFHKKLIKDNIIPG